MSHVLGLLVGVIGPPILYWTSQNDFVKENARRAMNWQITALFTMIILSPFGSTGVLLSIFVLILNLVFSTYGAVYASNGKLWKYPLSLNLIGEDTTKDTGKESVSVSGEITEEDRIKRVNNLYIEDMISEEEFERRLDRILKDSEEHNKMRELEKSKS